MSWVGILSTNYLNKTHTNSTTNSISSCQDTCTLNKTISSYYGVQGSFCHCGNGRDEKIQNSLLGSYRNLLIIKEDTLCREIPCPGNHNEFCGGLKGIAVYIYDYVPIYYVQGYFI